MPPFRREFRGRAFNLEAGSSDFVKHPDQIVMIRREALAPRGRCLIPVRDLAAKVTTLRNPLATARDLLDAARMGDSPAIGELRIGRDLASLGVPNRRVRSGVGRVRPYDISALVPG